MMKIKKDILENKKKVLVGISGGVDSSVAALLLQKQGYKVEGVFAKVWQPDFIECTWRDEMKDAMRVCAKLKIPFHFLDLEEQYKKNVADYMILEYTQGRTPNPDVMCNTHIKFGFIYDFAMQKGFDYVATGHYAQNISNQLHRGLDTNKDQSYFLWNVAKEKFNNILFPIGHLEKKEVRKIAEQNNLFTSEKKDSQGLCFIGQVDMKSFLKKLIPTKSGSVLDAQGNVIGVHEGAVLYTIGERHGFTIDPKYKDTNSDSLFVVSKDISTNTITVSDKSLSFKKIYLAQENFFSVENEDKIEVQFRYRQNPLSAQIKKEGNVYVLEFKIPIECFVAPGQSAVLYKDKKCVGGAIIEKVVY